MLGGGGGVGTILIAELVVRARALVKILMYIFLHCRSLWRHVAEEAQLYNKIWTFPNGLSSVGRGMLDESLT